MSGLSFASILTHSLPLEASPTMVMSSSPSSKLAQAVAKNNVVVRHQNANYLFCFCHISREESRPSAALHGPE